ncbi:MAG: hypothetical protein HC924_13450 [Synechococcaceae cyanobacterium SM2_3_2]|nr:hypothetical protein [Synechococcaceae cyanobacterium SM2_3_2]
MVQPFLQQTLSIIEAERTGNFHESFRLVDELLKEYGEQDIAEHLYRDIPTDCSWEVVADLFGILIWSMSDAGAAALFDTTNQWLLEGDNLRKIRIALNIDLYPFRNSHQMRDVLFELANRYPEIAQQCHKFIASRKT